MSQTEEVAPGESEWGKEAEMRPKWQACRTGRWAKLMKEISNTRRGASRGEKVGEYEL